MNAVTESSFELIATKADPPHQMNFPTDALSLIRKSNSVWKQWEIITNSVFRVLMNRLQRQIQTCIPNEAGNSYCTQASCVDTSDLNKIWPLTKLFTREGYCGPTNYARWQCSDR